MLSFLKNEDKLNELVPTRPCCPQCQTVLSNKTVSGNETALDKIPNDLRNAKNTSDEKKKYNEDEELLTAKMMLLWNGNIQKSHL